MSHSFFHEGTIQSRKRNKGERELTISRNAVGDMFSSPDAPPRPTHTQQRPTTTPPHVLLGDYSIAIDIHGRKALRMMTGLRIT